MEYYLPDNSKIDRNDFILLRGGCCEGCGSTKELTIHHMLIEDLKKKGKKIKELQYVMNLMVLCKHCHVDLRLYKGYDERVKYWWIQCKRYGHDKMVEWIKSVPLLTREKYELLDE